MMKKAVGCDPYHTADMPKVDICVMGEAGVWRERSQGAGVWQEREAQNRSQHECLLKAAQENSKCTSY